VQRSFHVALLNVPRRMKIANKRRTVQQRGELRPPQKFSKDRLLVNVMDSPELRPCPYLVLLSRNFSICHWVRVGANSWELFFFRRQDSEFSANELRSSREMTVTQGMTNLFVIASRDFG
jgi:hypothetical protein